MRKGDLKRVEAICKMAEHKIISGLYITYGLQGLTYRTTCVLAWVIMQLPLYICKLIDKLLEEDK